MPSRFLDLHLTLVSLWVLTLRQHPSPVSTTYAPLGKSAHLWITLWPPLLVLLWSLRDLIMLIPSCLVVHRSTRLVFNAYSKHSPESQCSSPLFLHLRPPNFLNNLIGFRASNSESDLSLPPCSLLQSVNAA